MGVVAQPVSLGDSRRFFASLDYFSIKVYGGISLLGSQTILERCYRSETDLARDGGLCRLVSRDLDTRQLTITETFLNIVTETRRGWELVAKVGQAIGPIVVEVSALVVNYDEQSQRLTHHDPKIDMNGIISVPEWTGTFTFDVKWNDWNLHYNVDWIGGDRGKTMMYFESQFGSSAGLSLTVPDYYLHTFSVTHRNERGSFTFGIRNIFDRDPPRVSTSRGLIYNQVGNAPLYSGYDHVGRETFVSFEGKF
jgi:outer membrane receptor protein involved in Fe transport